MHDPADHAPVIGALDTTHIRWQVWLNPCPLLVAQSKQISAHQFFSNTNQHRIVQMERLMGSDPSSGVGSSFTNNPAACGGLVCFAKSPSVLTAPHPRRKRLRGVGR